jgi:hypothetical protein
MSNSDIENKVYFGVHSEKSVVTEMLTIQFWAINFVTAIKNNN